MIITDEKVSTPHNELPGHEFDAESALSAMNSEYDTEAEQNDWGPPPPYVRGAGVSFGNSEYAVASGSTDIPVTRPPEGLTPVPSHKKDTESIRSTISSAMTLALLFLPLFLFMIEIRMLYGDILAGNNIPRISDGVILGPILLQPPFQNDRQLPYVNPHLTSSPSTRHSDPSSPESAYHWRNGENEDRFSYSDFDGSKDDIRLFQRWRQRRWQRQSKRIAPAPNGDPQGVCHYSHHGLLLSADELYGWCSLDEKPRCHRWRHSGSKGDKFQRKTAHF